MLMQFGKKKVSKAGEAEKAAFPRHIAVIMDGNGRWARKRGLPRKAGHSAGAENFKKLAYYCRDIGLEYLTVYAFSTENWKRPEDEVSAIMKLIENYLIEAIEKMEHDGIRLHLIGDMSQMSERIRALAAVTDEKSKHMYDGLTVNMCINYGGRDDILRAAATYAARVKAGQPEALTEEVFESYTYFGNIPDPDLVIRPGGEMRVSNFMLWQCAYSEFYFTDVLWPDFNSKELDRAIKSFMNRNRRYGGIDKNLEGDKK